MLYDGYDYDSLGNVMAISDGRTVPRRNRQMAYDGLDRLTATGSCMLGTQTCWYYFNYDTLDNFTRVRTATGEDRYYCYDNYNRLTNLKTGSCTGASVVGLGYDERGNLSNKNGQAFAFDFGNRLREATGKETYQYDALGRRVSATSADGTIYSFYSQAGQLMAQRNERLAPIKASEYVYLNGSLVAQRDTPQGQATTVTYQHTDALGTPVAETDATGAVIRTSEYTPFGQLFNRPMTDGPGYTGHVNDPLTGLVQMQQRYYDPGIGRMLSMDPVTAYSSGDMRHFNAYAYANNNPYRFIDPDGRSFWDKIKNAILPSTMALGERGEPGTAASNTAGVFKQLANQALATGAFVAASRGSASTLVNTPQIPIANNELPGAAAVEVGTAAISALGGLGTRAPSAASGLGDLTRAEARAIQGVVNKAGRPIEVVGSAASGNRRGVGTNLPIGKGPGTRSDIDYVTPPSSLKYFDGLQSSLPGLDPNTGIIPGVGNQNIGPVIRFEP